VQRMSSAAGVFRCHVFPAWIDCVFVELAAQRLYGRFLTDSSNGST
jgi:hypothetical protein